jgi:hypothetical protein
MCNFEGSVRPKHDMFPYPSCWPLFPNQCHRADEAHQILSSFDIDTSECHLMTILEDVLHSPHPYIILFFSRGPGTNHEMTSTRIFSSLSTDVHRMYIYKIKMVKASASWKKTESRLVLTDKLEVMSKKIHKSVSKRTKH